MQKSKGGTAPLLLQKPTICEQHISFLVRGRRNSMRTASLRLASSTSPMLGRPVTCRRYLLESAAERGQARLHECARTSCHESGVFAQIRKATPSRSREVLPTAVGRGPSLRPEVVNALGGARDGAPVREKGHREHIQSTIEPASEDDCSHEGTSKGIEQLPHITGEEIGCAQGGGGRQCTPFGDRVNPAEAHSLVQPSENLNVCHDLAILNRGGDGAGGGRSSPARGEIETVARE